MQMLVADHWGDHSLELSPHVANNVSDAIEAFGVSLGPGVVLSYLWSGLFHPARKVREVRLAVSPLYTFRSIN